MGAVQYIDVPGFNALLLRKTFKDLSLPEALISRSHEWFGSTKAHWNGDLKKWTFPSGATISFGHLEHENAKFNYQSAAFQYIGFDEVTQFTESQYTYLFSRLRRLRSAAHVPLRMRSAANPDGVGFEWVKRRFVKPGSPNRPFISAKLSDNPHLDQAAYEESLNELDPITRARYLKGDWDVRPEGKKFKREWFEIVDYAPTKIRKAVRYWDLAATEAKQGTDPDWTVGTLMSIDAQGTVYINNVIRFRKTPGATEFEIIGSAGVDGRHIPIRMEQEPGASGIIAIDHYAKVLIGYIFSGDRVSGSKEVRANPFASYADPGENTSATVGKVKLVAGAWNDPWLDELTLIPDSEHDDQMDSASGAFNFIAGPKPSTAEVLAEAARQGRR